MFLKRFFVLLGVLVFSMSLMAQSNPADLDTSFGTNGKIVTDFFNSGNARALAYLSNGKFLLAGYLDVTNKDIIMACYNANGTLDTSFGTNGKVTTDLSTDNDTAYCIAVLSDGKIILGGCSGLYAQGLFTMVKYNSNGTLDTTFGTNGKVTTAVGSNDVAVAIASLANGKILLGGFASSGTTDTEDFAIVRYLADGTLDTTFGTNGKVRTDFNAKRDNISSIKVFFDGKILAGGNASDAGGTYKFGLIRYNEDGTLDTTFGTNGKVITDVISGQASYITELEILADGKILATGAVANGGSGYDIALVKYNNDGSLDTTFGTNGKVITDFTGNNDQGTSMKISSDGKILVAGTASNNFAIVRYNSNGTLDTTFGASGKISTDFSNQSSSSCFKIAIQTDGKIIAGGKGSNGTQTNFALARYMGDSKLISLQIGALPKDQGGLSEYLLKLPFGTTPQDVRVHLEWDDSTGALLRLKRQWPAARGEKDRETRGLKTLDVVYKNVSGNFDLVIKHQPAVGTNPGSAGHARNIVVSIYCASLPTSLTLTPWIGDPGIGGLPFVHKLSLYAAPTHFTSEYPTGANVTEQINTTPTWEWIMNDSTASFLTYPAEIKVDWE